MPRSEVTYMCAINEFKNIVKNSVFVKIADLNIEAYCTKEPTTYENRMSGEKKTLKVGDCWGDMFDCAWFHVTANIPKECSVGNGVFAPKIEDLFIVMDMSGEACIYDKDGNPYRGLTTRCALYEQWINTHHKKTCEIAPFVNNGKIDIWMDCGANDVLGSLYNNAILLEANLAMKNPNFYKLNYDLEVLCEMADLMPQDNPRTAQIREALYTASKEIITGTNLRSGVNHIGAPEKTKEIKIGDEASAKRALDILAPVLAKRAGDTPITHNMVGHSHIDLAWLWPIRETIRKCTRTFSTVMRNFDRYPDYKFVQSQAQAYNWIKDGYPVLFNQIKEKVKEGRWEVNGGMWVEADGNVASGESFVRQFLYGKRFFKDEFGVNSEVCHLPDTFGYSGALPQIIKEAGLNYFLFQKMDVNMHNKFPYHSFKWRGIDGTEILAHRPPVGTYQSNCLPHSMFYTEKNYMEKAVSEHVLALFGIGDGGGGPGEEHLERINRQKDLYGVCKNTTSTSIDFFKKLETEKDKFNTWIGEMYLEYHQGTLTSQARNKKWNRTMEFALRNVEILSTWGAIASDIGYKASEIEKVWKEVLLYQFHDILPGSSIKRVYDESLARYEALYKEVSEISNNVFDNLNLDTTGFNKPVAVLNTLSWERDELVKVDNTWVKASAPSMGYNVVELAEAVYNTPSVTKNSLENNKIKVTFADNGNIVSLFDKISNKEVIKTPSNKLVIHEDTIDAWDMYADYNERQSYDVDLIGSEIGTDGPIAFIKQTYKYNNSTITQKIVLKDNDSQLDFDTEVDWREANKMLRVYFDVNINAEYSRSDIQFGNIKRSLHDYTTWDMAKYEICAHKWIDISEKRYGVALLNDCKYGHSAKGSLMSINLLRSTSYPDPEADMAVHNFKYALYPHAGDYEDGLVVARGYEFNAPLCVKPITSSNNKVNGSNYSFIKTNSNNLVIEAVKKAEDSNNIIVRIYECYEDTKDVEISFGFDVKSASLVNLLEEVKEKLEVKNNTVTVKTAPYKIITLLLEI